MTEIKDGPNTLTQFRQLKLGLMLHRMGVVGVAKQLVALPVILHPARKCVQFVKPNHRRS